MLPDFITKYRLLLRDALTNQLNSADLPTLDITALAPLGIGVTTANAQDVLTLNSILFDARVQEALANLGINFNSTANTTPNNAAPFASNVRISNTGTPRVGDTLLGVENITDSEGDALAPPQYYWYRADDTSGTNKTTISGATTQNYTLVTADLGKAIARGVRPLASSGTQQGSLVVSAYTSLIQAAGSSTTQLGMLLSEAHLVQRENVTYNNGALAATDATNNGLWRMLTNLSFAPNQTGFVYFVVPAVMPSGALILDTDNALPYGVSFGNDIGVKRTYNTVPSVVNGGSNADFTGSTVATGGLLRISAVPNSFQFDISSDGGQTFATPFDTIPRDTTKNYYLKAAGNGSEALGAIYYQIG